MDRWEYIIEIIKDPDNGMAVDELNSRGNVGWELVSVRDSRQSVIEYIFKRKIANIKIIKPIKLVTKPGIINRNPENSMPAFPNIRLSNGMPCK